jgi:8-oxo-dGTP pyrophosphatase MutT (NUDIX family)
MNQERATVNAPRAASTLILLRDTETGPEVLLLKRHGLSDVLGEAFVFPGGKLDPADVALDAASLDEAPATLRARLAEGQCETATAAGLFVAAIREACEESGILLARDIDESERQEVESRVRAGAPFGATVAASNVRLAASELVPWSRWITPLSQLQAKRFDTRFFVARAPHNVLARHDGRETTEAAWMQPRRALQRYAERAIQLAPPQIMTLAHLARHGSVNSVLDEARRRPPFLVEPEVHATADEPVVLCFPGDALHSVPQPVMPGPTRLTVRDKRYGPDGGFDALIG